MRYFWIASEARRPQQPLLRDISSKFQKNCKSSTAHVKCLQPFSSAAEFYERYIIHHHEDQKKLKIKERIQSRIKTNLNQYPRESSDLSLGKGFYRWLNAPPLKTIFIDLKKTEFGEGNALDVPWSKHRPSKRLCGENFNVTHWNYCVKRGIRGIRHIGKRNTFVKLLDEVCVEVEIEPKLQSLHGETFPIKSTGTL